MPTRHPARVASPNPKRSSNAPWYIAAFIAGFLVLGVFFGVFQPTALQAYANESVVRGNLMLSDIERKYNIYAQESQGLLPGNVLNGSGLTCGNDQIYRGLAEHSTTLQRIAQDTAPEPQFSQIPYALGFWDSEIATLHARSYRTYEDAFGHLRDHQEALQNILKFLDFRNSWIDACDRIQPALQNAPVISACQEALRVSQAYLDTQNPIGQSQVQALIRQCQTTEDNRFNYSASWLFEFLNLHNRLLEVDLARIITAQEADLTQHYNQVRTSIENQAVTVNDLLEEKKRFGYVLNFDPRSFLQGA